MSGRVSYLAWSPDWDGAGHPALYLAAETGGIWRSTDSSTVHSRWEPITDHLPLPFDQRIGALEPDALAVNPRRPRELYASTDRCQGILVSTDGGDHWSIVGHAYFVDKTAVERIVVDPTDPSGNVWFVVGGKNTGDLRGGPAIHRTPDSGTTWEPRVGGLPVLHSVEDLVAIERADGGLRLYAAVTARAGAADLSGIWSSDDGGLGWSPMPIDLVDRASGASLTASSIARIVLAAGPAPANDVYAAISNADVDGQPILNVFRLDGDTWRPAGGNLPASMPTQDSSNMALGVAPDGVVYFGGVAPERQAVFRSTDRGATWIDIGVGSDGVAPHHDFHAWGFAPGLVFAGNDGGIWRYLPDALDAHAPGRWSSLNSIGLQTIQSNGVGVDPANPDVMLEGSQDNGVARREGNVWTAVHAGDSGAARFEADPAQGGQSAYFMNAPEAGETYFFASTDGGRSWTPTRPDDFNVPDIPDYAPFAVHPTDAGRVAIGLDRVFERANRGAPWRAVSPVLEQGDLATALAYGRVAGTIVVAYEHGHVWLTTDGGGNGEDPSHWTELSHGTDWGGKPSALLTDPVFPSVFFLLTDGGHVWRSVASGASWENVTGALPAGLSIAAGARPSLFSPARGALFLGTSMGVFVSRFQSNTTCWVPYLFGLPEVRVSDLQEHYLTDTLVAATFGRGIYVAPLKEVVEPTLKLVYPRSKACRPTAVVGAQITLDAQVVGLPGARFEWTADGATLAPATGSQTTVTLPDAPLAVHVTVSARGDACVLNGQADIVPLTVEQADLFEKVCNLRKNGPRKLPNWPIDPLGDPLRDRPVAVHP